MELPVTSAHGAKVADLFPHHRDPDPYVLNAQSERLLREGKLIETPEENLAELLAQAKGFSTKRLPILQALGIA